MDCAFNGSFDLRYFDAVVGSSVNPFLLFFFKWALYPSLIGYTAYIDENPVNKLTDIESQWVRC